MNFWRPATVSRESRSLVELDGVVFDDSSVYDSGSSSLLHRVPGLSLGQFSCCLTEYSVTYSERNLRVVPTVISRRFHAL